MSDEQSSYIDQTWQLSNGTLHLEVTTPNAAPAKLVADLGPVVAAIEEFMETWGPQPAVVPAEDYGPHR
jgi:hypothetical protein